MSQIFRVFVRHESDAQPAYIKVLSDLSHEEFVAEIEAAVGQPGPSTWRCTDVDLHTWIFRADKVYTVCVYPPESTDILIDPADDMSASSGPATDPGTTPVADAYTYDDLDATDGGNTAAAVAADGATEESTDG